jgi:N4-(beta-N-acetylglucosaminyl)-L-asparaginase
MRHGMEPQDACLDALKRIARNFDGNRAKLLQFDISFYALRKDGAYAGASLWNNAKFSVNEGGDSQIKPCIPLMQR